MGKCKGTSWPTISKLHKKVHLIYKDSDVPIYGTLMEIQTENRFLDTVGEKEGGMI